MLDAFFLVLIHVVGSHFIESDDNYVNVINISTLVFEHEEFEREC